MEAEEGAVMGEEEATREEVEVEVSNVIHRSTYFFCDKNVLIYHTTSSA